MTVLSIEGKPLESALSKEDKAHHPERVMKRRQQLSATLKGLQEGWMKDNGEDAMGATKPNDVAIDRHYDERWREECRVANSAQEAVDADAEAMATWMKLQREGKTKHERFNTPMHKLHDLEEFEFRLVGKTDDGLMWLSSHIALCVAENGEVRGYVRDSVSANINPEWSHLLHRTRFLYGISQLFIAIDYTPHELFTLLGAMRVPKITWPTEETLAAARVMPNDPEA